LIGPDHSDCNQPNSQFSTPWQSFTPTEQALDLDQRMTRFRREAGVAKALTSSTRKCSPPWDCAASTRLLRSTITCWRFEAASALVKNHEGELRLFKSDSDGSIFELAMPVDARRSASERSPYRPRRSPPRGQRTRVQHLKCISGTRIVHSRAPGRMPCRQPPHLQRRLLRRPAASADARHQQRLPAFPAGRPWLRRFEWIAQNYLAPIQTNQIRTRRRLPRSASA
jgi:hypothetical protein